jgi:hypothetical protein
MFIYRAASSLVSSAKDNNCIFLLTAGPIDVIYKTFEDNLIAKVKKKEKN